MGKEFEERDDPISVPPYIEATEDPISAAQAEKISTARAEEKPSIETAERPIYVAQAVVKILNKLKVTRAFGISGGAIAPFCHALANSELEMLHFRHESGATFAACEASLANNQPVAVFVTTGPGITNALTGLFAGRWEGAKVIFISASTSLEQRGKLAFQETSPYTMPADLFTPGTLFDYATTLETPEQLPEIARRLAAGLKRSEGFMAHVSLPTGVQTRLLEKPLSFIGAKVKLPVASGKTIKECGELLFKTPEGEDQKASFAILVGFGARHAVKQIRKLAEATGAAVMCSPRAKGIFPENHPQFVGVTGFGGHQSVFEYLKKFDPQRVLVLGASLGEFTSFWNPGLINYRRFIQVDSNREVLGVTYPSDKVLCVESEIRPFVKKLYREYQNKYRGSQSSLPPLPHPTPLSVEYRSDAPVQPEVLMDAIQRIVIDKHDLLVMAEPGNSFAWTIHCLRFAKPNYRVSVGFGSLGHFVTGVIGASLARQQKAVVIAGDGAMLMNGLEISTAVKYEIPAIWIVLNDGRYNMCEQGMALQKFKNVDVRIPEADFVMIAQALGAEGICVEKDTDLEAALERAVASTKPFVLDVRIDPNVVAPIGSRVKSLMAQTPGGCQ
ncbi:MAG: thiamine pyrophosphate-binding protein [Oscillatoria princeps RMCB-10]|nr:thiamine pyrophosphate-binding protein [Oscillatoria princeps RMCB-10]